jgi:DNA replication protein DnaC
MASAGHSKRVCQQPKTTGRRDESFSGWTMTFTDPRLCAAIVDRLTFTGAIIEAGTDSYRLAHTLKQQT